MPLYGVHAFSSDLLEKGTPDGKFISYGVALHGWSDNKNKFCIVLESFPTYPHNLMQIQLFPEWCQQIGKPTEINKT